MTEELSNKDYELINSYLDQELDRKGVLQFAERMSEDPAIRAEVEDLMKVKTMVKELPTVNPPRNYMLTRAMAEEARPKPFWERLLPVFRTAAAFCALALIFVFAFPSFSGRQDNAAKQSESTPMYAEEESVTVMKSIPEDFFRDEEIVLDDSYAAVMPSYGVMGGNPRIEYMMRMEEQANAQNAAPLDPENPPEGFVSVEQMQQTNRTTLIIACLSTGLILSLAGVILLSRRKKSLEVS